jgi:FkbM family methyltransferase
LEEKAPKAQRLAQKEALRREKTQRLAQTEALKREKARLKLEQHPGRVKDRLLEESLRLVTQGHPEAGPTLPVETIKLNSRLGEFDAVKVPVDGMTFFAPLLASAGDDSFLDRLRSKRKWPANAIATLLPFMRAGDMLDLGANIGLTSIPRAVLGYFHRIHAFEPEPRNFACLVAGAKATGVELSMTFHEAAIGRISGEMWLTVAEGIAKHHVMSTASSNSVRVPIVSLDDWASNNNIDPRTIGYVKSDTQGFEPHMLAGATTLLSVPNVAWQLEVHPRLMKHGGSSIEEFSRLVEQHFKAYIDFRNMDRGIQPVGNLQQTIDAITTYVDIIAFTRGR